MKEISTSININASVDKVWSVLTNFSEYPNWNPFIVSITGQMNIGNKIKVTMSPPDSKSMIFYPKITIFEEKKELQWFGHLIFPGLFDGRHIFRLSTNGDKSVTFIQEEFFSGLLVPLFENTLDNNTKKGFLMMNEKLKEICENE